MNYFHNFCRLLGASPPDPHQGSTLDPAGGLSFPDPLICPPLEKILRAPMGAGRVYVRAELRSQTHFSVFTVFRAIRGLFAGVFRIHEGEF